MEEYREHFVVRQYETDRHGALRLPVFCNYMEEVAGIHAARLGVGLHDLLPLGLSWAMRKMRLHILRMPLAGEPTLLATWPCTRDKLTFRRDYLLTREPTGEPLVAATTQWVIFDMHSRKLAQLPDRMLLPLEQKPNPYIDNEDLRIPPVRRAGHNPSCPSFTIRQADIDANDHVNNVRYVEFVLEAALPCSALALKALDIIFRAEARYGDLIESVTAPVDGTDLAFHHALACNGTELVRARTVFGHGQAKETA